MVGESAYIDERLFPSEMLALEAAAQLIRDDMVLVYYDPKHLAKNTLVPATTKANVFQGGVVLALGAGLLVLGVFVLLALK